MNVSQVLPGQKISFKTISTLYNDSVWVGTAKGTVSYDVARNFSDVAAYHAELQQNTDEDLGDVKDLTFLLVECTDGKIRAFAATWIEGGTVDLVGIVVKRIEVYNITDIQVVLNLLRDHGIQCTDITDLT